MIFLFIWVRASVPRVRYDQLLKFCWTFLFPLSLVYLAITAVGVVLLALSDLMRSVERCRSAR